MTIYLQAKEKISSYGKDEVGTEDLIAFLMGPKVDQNVIKKVAQYDVTNLIDFSIEDFLEIQGVRQSAAERLFASLSLIEKLLEERANKKYAIRSPEDAVSCFADIAFQQQEYLSVLFLNTKMEVIGKKAIFAGGLNSSIVHPREIFREALKFRSCSIIMAHNHPSGYCDPSSEDLEVTKRVVEAGKIIGIEVLDHLIVSRMDYYSLKEKGYL